MNDEPKKSATEKFEESLNAPESEGTYLLRLYVSGMTPRSVRAIEKIKEICRTRLKHRYELEVIDIYQQPEMGKSDQIVAVPTLLKKLPTPLRKFIGDLSNTEKILIGLDLKPKPPATESPNE